MTKLKNNFAESSHRQWSVLGLEVAVFVWLILGGGCKEKITDIEPVLPIGQVEPVELESTAKQIILDSLSDPDPRIRAKAAEVVATTRQRLMMPRVQKLLTDPYVPVRFSAAVAIGDMEYYLAKGELERLVQVADENTKIGAAYALYRLGYKEYIDVIRKAVLSKDQILRANAVVLLGKSNDNSVLRLLYWAKDADDSEPKVRYQAAEAIARLGDEKIIPKLWTLLISKYVDNKIIGIHAVGALGTAEAKEILLTKLDDDILEVRLAAAEQLGMLGERAGEDKVLSVFKDNLTEGMDRQDRERILVLTALAIGRIDTPKLRRYLPILIKDESKLVRLAAAEAVLLSEAVR